MNELWSMPILQPHTRTRRLSGLQEIQKGREEVKKTDSFLTPEYFQQNRHRSYTQIARDLGTTWNKVKRASLKYGICGQQR